MDHGDDTLRSRLDSNASSSSTSINFRSKPNCARCQNHQLKITLKGHKRFCKYRYCICEKCILISERQNILARQNTLKRAQQLVEGRIRSPHKVEPVPVDYDSKRIVIVANPVRSVEGSYDGSSGDSPISNHGSTSIHSRISGVVTIPSARKLPPVPSHSTAVPHPPQSQNTQKVELLLGYSMRLMERFQYLYGMPLTLMYVILKDCSANIDEASRRIIEDVDSYRLKLKFLTIIFNLVTRNQLCNRNSIYYSR